MKSPLFRKRTLALLLLVAAVGSSGFAQEKQKVTVEWIYSDESRETFALPLYQWLDNSRALYYDVKKPQEERTLEILDPLTGELNVLLDTAKARQSLEKYLGKEGTPKALAWPEVVTGDARYAAYSFGGDIYILDTTAARFLRVTDTPEEEIGARISPDGGLIAYVRGRNIYVYDLLRKTERPLTGDGSDTILNGELSFMYGEDVFNREATELWWSPDSQALAYLQIDVSDITEFQYEDFQPFNPRVIKQRYPLVGEKIETARVGIAELSSGGTTWVDVTGRPDEYVVHVDWLPGGRKLSVQILNRDQDVLDLYFADRETGRSRHILKEADEAWVNVGDDLYFLKDGKRFIWGSEDEGFKHLYLYDSDGKLLSPITRGNWAVRAPFQTSYWNGRSVVAIDEKSQSLFFTGLEKSSLERHLYKIRFDGSGMQRLTREDGFHSVTFSPDGRFYFDLYSTVSTPPSLYLCRSDGTARQLLAGPKFDVLAGFDIQSPEIFTVPADDGFALPAQLLKPRDFDPKKRYPVILYHYGGPSAPTVLNIWQGMNLFHQILLDKGYLVFSVDNRSATGISKTLENTILHQMIGPNELKDLVAGVKWLKSQPFVDPERVGIWGWSYGGCMTLLALTRSHEFKAGIAVAPVTDQRFHEPKWAEFAMKRPQDRLEDWEAVSLLRYAKDLHGRLMIVHGTYDDNVRIVNTWAFVDALVQAGKDFDMMVYPMRKHGIADRPARINLFDKMVEFWTRNL